MGFQPLPTPTMKVTKELLSKQSNLLRPYKSRTQRPCDFCRKRKTCCIIEKSIPCTLCIKFNKGVCTFNEGPVKRVNRNTSPRTRVRKEASEPSLDSPRAAEASAYKESLAKHDRELAGSLLINRGKHMAGLELPGLKIPALASQQMPPQNYLLSYQSSQPQQVFGNGLYDYLQQQELSEATRRFSIDKTSLSLSVETVSTLFDNLSLLGYSLPQFPAAQRDLMPNSLLFQQGGFSKGVPQLLYATNLPPHTLGYDEVTKPVLSYDEASVYEQHYDGFKGLPNGSGTELNFYDF